MLKINKKLKIGTCILATFGLIATGAASSLAQDGYLGASGTINDTNTTMADNTSMDITLSPGVEFQFNTSDTAYALATQNETTTVGDRNTYGVASVYAGYYMEPSAGDWDDATDELTSTGTANFAGWTQQ
ncbi:MAG: hypothetical protein OEY01_15190 [Desulfobulbaceae bacterium]|nr:hypothetical protein [Desulfobulbaceae bacterium]